MSASMPRWGILAVLAVGAALAQAPPTGAPAGAPPPGAPPAAAAQDPSDPPRTKVPVPDEEVLRSLLPPLPANAPKPSANPHDLEGTWTHDQVTVSPILQDMYRRPIPLTPAGRAIRDRRAHGDPVAGAPYSNASAECRPAGQPWEMELYYPFQFYQTGNNIVFSSEYEHTIWNIRMNSPHQATRKYMGDSVAHWDGDTLVVDTTNYKRGLWIDFAGAPASGNLHMIQRIRRIDDGGPKLEIVTTFDDPKNYTKPWSIVRTFAWRPDKTIFGEYNCESQVGAPNGIARYGLVPEPTEDQ
jgi:hypothetical protein